MQINISLGSSPTNEQIKTEVRKLQAEIEIRSGEIKVLQQAISYYRNQCKHEGQKTGHNERDGSWGNPCPTCGYAY